ncbi:MAG: hypothetical protein WCS73_12945, partial [Lentisphaeria bacterium]
TLSSLLNYYSLFGEFPFSFLSGEDAISFDLFSTRENDLNNKLYLQRRIPSPARFTFEINTEGLRQTANTPVSN